MNPLGSDMPFLDVSLCVFALSKKKNMKIKAAVQVLPVARPIKSLNVAPLCTRSKVDDWLSTVLKSQTTFRRHCQLPIKENGIFSTLKKKTHRNIQIRGNSITRQLIRPTGLSLASLLGGEGRGVG